MQYMGGKSRIARPIAEIINTALTGGGGSVQCDTKAARAV